MGDVLAGLEGLGMKKRMRKVVNVLFASFGQWYVTKVEGSFH